MNDEALRTHGEEQFRLGVEEGRTQMSLIRDPDMLRNECAIHYERGLRDGALAKVTGPTSEAIFKAGFDRIYEKKIKACGLAWQQACAWYRDNLKVSKLSVDEIFPANDVIQDYLIKNKCNSHQDVWTATSHFIREYIAKKLGTE